MLLQIAEQVDEPEAAAQQEHEHGDDRACPAGDEAHRREVDHARQGETEHCARCGERLGQAQAGRHEVGGEEVDHEGVSEPVTRIDRVLGRKVVRVRERAGKAQVRRPVAPDVHVAGKQSGRRVDVRLVQEVRRPRAAHDEHRQQRPGVREAARRRDPSAPGIEPIGHELCPAERDTGDAEHERSHETGGDRGPGHVVDHQRGHEAQARHGHRADHRSEDDPLLEVERHSREIRDSEPRRRARGEKQDGR